MLMTDTLPVSLTESHRQCVNHLICGDSEWASPVPADDRRLRLDTRIQIQMNTTERELKEKSLLY